MAGRHKKLAEAAYAYRALSGVVASGLLDGWVLVAQGQMPEGMIPVPALDASSYMARPTNHDWSNRAALAHVFPTRAAAEAARVATRTLHAHYVFTVEHVSEIVPRLLANLGRIDP